MVVHTFDPRIQETKPFRSVQGQSTKQVPEQPSLGHEGVRKQKAGDNVIEQGDMLQPLQAVGLGSFGHVALALESRLEGTTGTIDAG